MVQSSHSLDYIECLFVSSAQGAIESPLHGNQIHSVESALHHVEYRLSQGLSHWLVVAVNDHPGLDQIDDPEFCVARFLEKASSRWSRDQAMFIADVGLSPYLSSGQSVVLENGIIDVEASYQAAIRLALRFAEAGAHYVAPCLSLPKQTSKLRDALSVRHMSCGLMPYSTKFSSCLYGPYRSTVGSSLGLTRKSYQFDFSDSRQALHQMTTDFMQGAEMSIVKPALPYLDVLQEACRVSEYPIAAYHVSGEYMMAVHAAREGVLDLVDYFAEIHAAIARCGARYVIGYAADYFLQSSSLAT
jgi:porphobilinogen synthase